MRTSALLIAGLIAVTAPSLALAKGAKQHHAVRHHVRHHRVRAAGKIDPNMTFWWAVNDAVESLGKPYRAGKGGGGEE